MSVVRAREAFAFTDASGVPRVVRAGDLFAATNPDALKRPHLFEAVETAVTRQEENVGPTPTPPGSSIEQTTAAPGERRSVAPTTNKGGNGRGARGGGTAAS